MVAKNIVLGFPGTHFMRVRVKDVKLLFTRGHVTN